MDNPHNEGIINLDDIKSFPVILIYSFNIFLMVALWRKFSTFYDSWSLNFAFLIIMLVYMVFLAYIFNLISTKMIRDNRSINRYLINMKHFILSIIIAILFAIIVVSIDNQVIYMLIYSISMILLFGYLLIYHLS